MVAAIRGHSDIAVGNVIGSNLFNMLGVGGTVAVVTPLAVAEQIRDFDIWVMLAATAAFLPFLIFGLRLGRPVGIMFLIGYAAYIAFLVLGPESVGARVG